MDNATKAQLLFYIALCLLLPINILLVIYFLRYDIYLIKSNYEYRKAQKERKNKTDLSNIPDKPDISGPDKK